MTLKKPTDAAEAEDLVRRCAQHYAVAKLTVARAEHSVLSAASDLMEAEDMAHEFLSRSQTDLIVNDVMTMEASNK